VDNYQPSGTGESPLALIKEFVETTCPKCKCPARRETDTMGGYACSSWYFLRFADPHNDRASADREKIDYWLPVDLYSGGVEHARSHLLYSRFWCKVLYDAGLIGWTEPFKILRNQGSMLARTPGRKPKIGTDTIFDKASDSENSIVDWIVLKGHELNTFPKDKIVWKWARMSKSKENTISPDEIIKKYGADSLRLYEMFVAPFEEDVQWTEEGIKGSYRFVNRLWRWLANFTSEFIPDWKDRIRTEKLEPDASRIRRKLHQTIKRVGTDIENFRFNTAISSLMELVNELYIYALPSPPKNAQTDRVPDFKKTYNNALISEVLENLVLITAPFAPHLAEEIWEQIGKKEFVCHTQWPLFDPDIAKESERTIVIQVNGKLRSRITVPAEINEKQIEQAAFSDKTISKLIKDKQILKTIVVRKQLVNIVLR
jgi:leucyl-tRNA synthetase